MRAFIAIELPQEIKDSLRGIQGQLRKTGADVKWVEPNNIHLTLKFLGDIEDSKLVDIIQILQGAVKDAPPFTARVSSVGAFPKINSPRVIWAGIEKGDEEIKKIAQYLQEKAAKLGIPPEDRPFSSHITIGRTRSGLNQYNLVKELTLVANKFTQETSGMEFTIAKITLFKSTLTPSGPVYEALKVANLCTS